MEPIPETSEAVDEFGPFEADLLEHLKAMAASVRELVPSCVGISVASHALGVSFTLVATDEEIAALDGVRYLADGPSVEAVEARRIHEYRNEELFSEDAWHLFARATAAAAVASTLTLPVLSGTEVVGSVNLYAATPDAFTGHQEAIANIFDAWAPGAVTNADLDFTTRGIAEQAPQLLDEELRIQFALGTLIARHDISLSTAKKQLRDAALRAGISELALAHRLIQSLSAQDRATEE